MKAYIISHFGSSEVRDKRKDFHSKQLEWLFKHGIKPIIYAQEYDDNDYHPNVEYVIGPPLHPGEARNILLKIFYNSDDDYALFLDNDAIIDPKHQDGSSFSDIDFSKLVDYRVHCFTPINPGKTPFNKMFIENKKLLDNNYWFKRHMDLKTTFFGLCNLKKLYGKEVYFDDRYKPFGEDTDFSLQIVFNGFGMFECQNLVLKDFGHSISTLIGKDTKLRTPEMNSAKKLISEKWSQYGLVVDENNSIIRKAFTKKYWCGPDRIIIPKLLGDFVEI